MESTPALSPTRSRTGFKAFVWTGLGIILGMQVLFTILLATPAGIRIDYPIAGHRVPRTLPLTGTAWIRAGIERIEVTAVGADGTTVTAPAERWAVKYRGVTAFFISSWRGEIELPAEGAWRISATAVGSDGTRVSTEPRTVTVDAAARLREFRLWTPEHLVPLALLLAAWIVLPLVVRRANDPRLDARVAVALTLILWVDEIVYQVYWFGIGAWSTPAALMLQMCGLSILLIPVMFATTSDRARRFLFEILYFWGLGGAFQALFAPDIGFHGFPEMKYLGYFVSHGAIILSVLFAAAAWRIQLTWKSLVRVAVVTNLALVVAYGVNQLLRLIPPYEPGNYFVMGYPVPQGSVVDLFAAWFGPSPRYVIGLELMGAVVFVLLWLPYPIVRLVRRRREARAPR
jgi:hypothetical integral membrane protein (TIGR02206 family)